MSADAPGANEDYSTRSRPRRGSGARRSLALPGVTALRGALAVTGLAGVVLLVVSTFLTVVEIRVLTTTAVAGGVDTEVTGSDLHGVGLVVVALLALGLLAAALRGSRAATIGLVVAGVAALGLIAGLDVPELNETGQVSKFYEDARAGAASGFYVETLGGVLVLLAGGGLLLLGGTGAPRAAQPQ
jgi:hypothetical protein